MTITGDFLLKSSCNKTLAPKTSCDLSITYQPTQSGQSSGALTVIDGLRSQTIPLSGTGLSYATDALSAGSLTFAGQQVNTSSAAQTITLTNGGDLPLTGVVIQITGDFLLSNGCSATLGPHLGCVLSVTYRPTTLGLQSGTLTITDSLRTQAVALTGTGLAPPTDALAPLALVFPGQALNLTSTSQRVTLSNTGDVALTGISAQITGDFRINSGCPATLAAHTTCGFTVVYLPTVAGPETGTLIVTDSLSSQTVTLSGIGLSGATDSLSPTSLTFPGQQVNTPSTVQTITLSNAGDTTLDQISVTITGDFLLKSGCNKTLPPKTSCDLSITYQPTQPGQSSGALTVIDGLRSQTIPLSGTGLSYATDALSAGSLTFAGQQVNTSSAAQTITLTNGGDLPLTGIVVQVTGDFLLTNGCPATLGPHLGCVLSVIYRPTLLGPESGTLTLTDSLRTQPVALTGTGLAPPTDALAPLALVFPGQALNLTSTSQRVTLSDTGDLPLTGISAQITGDFRINSGCPATLAAHTTCGFTIVYLPTIAGPETGTLVVTDTLSSQTVTLSGTGLSGATDSLSPTSLNFPAQPVNTPSAAQTITLSNSGILPSIRSR